MPNAGYEYLLCYKLTVPIYDYTVEFCRRWIDSRSRTTDQMIQAARSGMQNIAEVYCEESLASYIKLAGVSYGSLEELLKDYLSFARQRKLPVWGKERVLRDLKELRDYGKYFGKRKLSPMSPNSPSSPRIPNMLLIL